MIDSCWCDCLAQTCNEGEKPRGKGEGQGLYQRAAKLQPSVSCWSWWFCPSSTTSAEKGICRQERKETCEEGAQKGAQEQALGCRPHKSAAGMLHPKPLTPHLLMKLSTDQVKQLLKVFVYSLWHESTWKKICLKKKKKEIKKTSNHPGWFLQG